VKKLKNIVDDAIKRIVLAFVWFENRQIQPRWTEQSRERKLIKLTALEQLDFPLWNSLKDNWNIRVVIKEGLGGLVERIGHEKYLITLGYRDENILYHELAHIAQDKLGYNMNSHPYSHIVVELVSCVLCYLVGKNLDFSESFNYIQERAEWKNKTVLDACTKVLYQTKRIVLFVLEESEISPRKFNKNVMLWPPLGW